MDESLMALNKDISYVSYIQGLADRHTKQHMSHSTQLAYLESPLILILLVPYHSPASYLPAFDSTPVQAYSFPLCALYQVSLGDLSVPPDVTDQALIGQAPTDCCRSPQEWLSLLLLDFQPHP